MKTTERNRKLDAIVIGGGPSGSSFALAAAGAGLRVILFERSTSAHHKVCGEFLSAETQVLLSRCDIDLDRMGVPKQKTLRLVSGRTQMEAPLPFCGRSLSRKTLDELLLQKASQAGVEVRRGSQITHLQKGDGADRATVTVAGGEKLSAPVVVMGTGASTVRGIEPRQISSLVGFKIMLSLTAAVGAGLADHVQLMGYDGGYQGALIVEDGLASLAWIMDAGQAKELGTDWQKHAAFLARQSQVTGDMLSGARTDWPRPLTVSGLQFGFLRSSVIGANIYPVGGQMAIIPSFTGDGLAVALSSGIEAARAVAAGKTADIYQQNMRLRLKPQFRWARAVHPLFLYGWTRWAGLTAARSFPGIVTLVTNSTRLRNLP
ncbi:MAG: lycopene cyclase family protein [Hyphomicrobiaceae bacterium]